MRKATNRNKNLHHIYRADIIKTPFKHIIIEVNKMPCFWYSKIHRNPKTQSIRTHMYLCNIKSASIKTDSIEYCHWIFHFVSKHTHFTDSNVIYSIGFIVWDTIFISFVFLPQWNLWILLVSLPFIHICSFISHARLANCIQHISRWCGFFFVIVVGVVFETNR